MVVIQTRASGAIGDVSQQSKCVCVCELGAFVFFFGPLQPADSMCMRQGLIEAIINVIVES